MSENGMQVHRGGIAKDMFRKASAEAKPMSLSCLDEVTRLKNPKARHVSKKMGLRSMSPWCPIFVV